MQRRNSRAVHAPVRPRTAAAVAAVLLLCLTAVPGASRAPAPLRGAALSAVVERAVADDGAAVTAFRRSGDRALDLTIRSPALGGRLTRVRVLLPPGYEEPAGSGAGRRWPVIFLLHGCCAERDRWQQWTRRTDVTDLTEDTGALIVMPDGGSVGYYSDWREPGGDEGPAAGWETYHLTELPQLLERGLRANGRYAVAGASMGGTGALQYAGRRPEMFDAAASFSGRLDTLADADAVLGKVARFHDDPRDMWGDPAKDGGVWAAHNPYDLLALLPEGFPLYLSCGNGEPGPLNRNGAARNELEAQFEGMAEAYTRRARSLGLAVTASLYGPGTHSWRYWDREFAAALPLLARAVGAHPQGDQAH